MAGTWPDEAVSVSCLILGFADSCQVTGDLSARKKQPKRKRSAKTIGIWGTSYHHSLPVMALSVL